MPRTIVIRIVVDNRDAVNAAKVQTESLKQLQMQTAANNEEMRKSALFSTKMADAHKEAGKAHDNLTASFLKGFIAARALSEAYSLVAGSIGFLAKSVVELETNFAKVKAVTGDSQAEISSLKDTVFTLGRTTAASTVEISSAALELAKLGFEGKNLEIALTGVARLSSILGDSLETTGNLVGSVIQTFNLSAEEAATVADKLFVATGKSATNIEGFRTSFNYAGASAEVAGVSFEELSTVLAILSNNGIRASTAGSGLRTVFTNLSTAGSKAEVALGGSIEGLGLLGVMRKLAELKLDPGSIADIFSKPAIPVVLNLAKMGDAFEKLFPQVKNANDELKRGGDVINNTLAGSFTLLTNSLTELLALLSSGPALVLVDTFKGVAEIVHGLSDDLKELNKFFETVGNGNAIRALGLGESRIENGRVVGPNANDITRKLQQLKEAQANDPKLPSDPYGVFGYSNPARGPDPAAAAIAAAKAAAQEKAYDDMAKAIRKSFDELKDLVAVQDLYNVSLSKSEIDDYVDSLQKMAITLTGIGRNKETAAILKTIADLKDRIREPFQEDTLAIIPDTTQYPSSFEQSVKNLSQGKDENLSKSQSDFEDYLTQASVATDEFNQRIGITTELIQGFSDAADLMASRIADNIVNLDNPFKHFGDTVKQIAKSFIADFIAMELRILAVRAAIGLSKLIFGGPAALLAPDKAGVDFIGTGAVEGFTAAASGYDGVVNSPRLFLAGEAGAERVKISPLGKSSANDQQQATTTIIVQGDVYNAERLIDKVAQTNERSKTRYV